MCYIQYCSSVLFSVPGSGSFIRPKKASFGDTFLTAVKKVCYVVACCRCLVTNICVYQRYGHGLNIEEESEMYVMSEDGSQVTPVEMVGTEKIAKKQG